MTIPLYGQIAIYIGSFITFVAGACIYQVKKNGKTNKKHYRVMSCRNELRKIDRANEASKNSLI